MAKLYLVRHGKAKADWHEDLNPGLDDLGWEQAKATARALASLGPLPIVSSPLRRALETAAPLGEAWNGNPRIDPRFGEIPFPGKDPVERIRWLREVMAQNWSGLAPHLQTWRDTVLEALRSLDTDSVVFTHFIAINVAVGAASGNHRVVCFWPANGSVTIMETEGSGLNLIRAGLEAASQVL